MKKIVVLGLLLVSSLGMAQKVKIVNGDLGFIASQKEINVVFVYDNLKLMKDNLSEAEYIKNRTADLNEKGNGNGEVWKKKWNGAKEGIWSPKFLELVNVVLSKEDKNITFQEGLTSAKYTLIVDAVWIFPGWDVAMMKQPAKVSTVLKFVETANRSKVVAEITSEHAPGDQWGSNFSNESRIGEGFAKTGKSLAKTILKEAF